jgi:hypothetical protein
MVQPDASRIFIGVSPFGDYTRCRDKIKNTMAKHLILVAGNIGAGKTSLTERIGARLGWWTGYESVVDNPYLSDFYGNMQAWSFHLQIFFL